MMKLLSYVELKERGINFTRAWISRLEQRGEFPKRIRIGCGDRGRVAWLEDEVEAWVTARMGSRGVA